jgi:hypothetical protein
MVETRQGVSTLVCFVCGQSRIKAPPLSTLLTRFTCRACCSAIGRRRHIMECRSDAEKRRDHLARCVEANRLRRERFREQATAVCESQNDRCGSSLGKPDILAAIEEATGRPVAPDREAHGQEQATPQNRPLPKTCKATYSPIGCKRTVKACNQRISHRPAAFTNSSGIFNGDAGKHAWGCCLSHGLPVSVPLGTAGRAARHSGCASIANFY